MKKLFQKKVFKNTAVLLVVILVFSSLSMIYKSFSYADNLEVIGDTEGLKVIQEILVCLI